MKHVTAFDSLSTSNLYYFCKLLCQLLKSGNSKTSIEEMVDSMLNCFEQLM